MSRKLAHIIWICMCTAAFVSLVLTVVITELELTKEKYLKVDRELKEVFSVSLEPAVIVKSYVLSEDKKIPVFISRIDMSHADKQTQSVKVDRIYCYYATTVRCFK